MKEEGDALSPTLTEGKRQKKKERALSRKLYLEGWKMKN